MAIVQISRITQRKGLQEDLPQLAGAELGWSVDARRLWIGNGTLEEGAPVIGNTEILTEFSDILALSQAYTYSGIEATGYAAQTGPTPGSPITTSLQNWLDQRASIKDFGAVGDGVTDDTEAINRALYQIYCVQVNPQIRRSIFFPAGVYRVTETILIPPYATLIGEGPDNTVIQMANAGDSTLRPYVARTCDSLQQINANIGTNGATAPYSINIAMMGFSTLDPDMDVFLIEDASEVNFNEVDFHGPLTISDLTTASNNTACIRFASTPVLVTDQTKFYHCRFGGCVYGMNTDDEVRSTTVESSTFDTLYQGVVLGEGTIIGDGPNGFAIIANEFNNIYAQGILLGDVSLNVSSQNIFYDVGNHFGGPTQPYTSIIDIQNGNNVSMGDMFERPEEYSTTYPRIDINNTPSIAFVDSEEVMYGTYSRHTGFKSTLANNTGTATTVVADTGQTFALSADMAKAWSINYTIVRDEAHRTGTITLASAGSGSLNYSDDYVQNLDTGIALTVTQTGTTINLKYTSTNTGFTAALTYSYTHLG